MAQVLGNPASPNCVPGDAASVKRALHSRRSSAWKTTRGVAVTGYKPARMGVSMGARGHS